MGVSALKLHSPEKKQANVIKEKRKYQGLFFKLAQSKSSDATESTRYKAEKTVNVVTLDKSKTIDKFMVNTHSIKQRYFDV